MSQTLSSQQHQVASAMPLQTLQHSKIQRFRRLLDNTRLSAQAVYQPIIRHALSGLRGQRVYVLLDRVVLTDTQNVLVVSVGFRRRSLPLVWKVLDHAGSSGLDEQQSLLDSACALLPDAVRISVLADSEFRSQALFAWIRARDWHAILGIRGTLLVSTAHDRPGQALTTWLGDRETVAYLTGVFVSDERCGPVNVLAWWDTDDRDKLICHAVMTDLAATWQTYRVGSRRMWIETMFRDWQSGAFELGASAISNTERFARLILLVCIVYVWFVSVGRWLVKRGYRALVDAGPSHAWHLSLFTLAVAWQNRVRSFEQPMPIRFFVYV